VRGIAGAISRGDFIDVVLTRRGPAESYSGVIMRQIKVLGVASQAEIGGDTPTVANLVTVELTAEQALKIALASTFGKLSLEPD
jgi:pilus assembly protein CpaB